LGTRTLASSNRATEYQNDTFLGSIFLKGGNKGESAVSPLGYCFSFDSLLDTYILSLSSFFLADKMSFGGLAFVSFRSFGLVY